VRKRRLLFPKSSPASLQLCQGMPRSNLCSRIALKMFLSILQIPVVVLALSALSTVAAQCSTSPPAQTANSLQNQTICLQNGSQRNYTLYLPEDYASGNASALHPLILSFHGGTVTPENQIQLDLLSHPFFNQDAVVAYPSGLDVCSPIVGAKADLPEHLARSSDIVGERHGIHE
jgi:poly(3-hydroxybutyrate) depolymerase